MFQYEDTSEKKSNFIEIKHGEVIKSEIRFGYL